jgi:KRAB domain-containing zinc finger protein
MYYHPTHLCTHKKRHHSVVAPKHQCDHENCGKYFFTRSLLTTHQITHTAKEKIFLCDDPDCDYSTHTATLLRQHLIRHYSPTWHACDYEDCTQMLSSKAGLHRHINSVHTMHEHFVCNICERVFYTSGALGTHTKINHTDFAKQHICQFNGCGKLFYYHCNLKKHEQTHSDAKNFMCIICDKFLKTQINLDKHIQFVHLNERKFHCIVCPSIMQTAAALDIHMMIHDNLRPIPCTECDSRFRTKDALKKHTSSIHSDQSKQIPKSKQSNLANFLQSVGKFPFYQEKSLFYAHTVASHGKRTIRLDFYFEYRDVVFIIEW